LTSHYGLRGSLAIRLDRVHLDDDLAAFLTAETDLAEQADTRAGRAAIAIRTGQLLIWRSRPL